MDSLEALIDVLERPEWHASMYATDRHVVAAVTAMEANAEPPHPNRGRALSSRQMHRLFVGHVGLGPKVFARVTRLGAAVREAAGRLRLADVAAAAGYADQAHMSRETRAFTGLSGCELRRPPPPNASSIRVRGALATDPAKNHATVSTRSRDASTCPLEAAP